MTKHKQLGVEQMKAHIRSKLNQEIQEFIDIAERHKHELDPYLDAFDKASDRDCSIIYACLLDNYLERLLTAFFVEDRRVKSIFKDDHILQSFYTKINISYFCGLIPKWLYNDLRLICEIRNKFAHEHKPTLRFNDELIIKRINNCELRPKTMDDVDAPRIKFMITVVQVATILGIILALLVSHKPNQLVDDLKMNDWDYERATLTKDKIKKILANSHEIRESRCSTLEEPSN